MIERPTIASDDGIFSSLGGFGGTIGSSLGADIMPSVSSVNPSSYVQIYNASRLQDPFRCDTVSIECAFSTMSGLDIIAR